MPSHRPTDILNLARNAYEHLPSMIVHEGRLRSLPARGTARFRALVPSAYLQPLTDRHYAPLKLRSRAPYPCRSTTGNGTRPQAAPFQLMFCMGGIFLPRHALTGVAHSLADHAYATEETRLLSLQRGAGQYEYSEMVRPQSLQKKEVHMRVAGSPRLHPVTPRLTHASTL